MFNKGDIIETIVDGGEVMHSYTIGTKAVVVNNTISIWNEELVCVKWIRTNDDGTPVLDRLGNPLYQSDGGYYAEQFRLVKAYGEPIKKLQKLNV
jgi:hypothetical protein